MRELVRGKSSAAARGEVIDMMMIDEHTIQARTATKEPVAPPSTLTLYVY